MTDSDENSKVGGAGASHRGTVYYDGDCSICADLVSRFGDPLRKRGWSFEPLQNEGVAEALGVDRSNLLDEMRVRTAEGRLFGGADAVLRLARDLPWARPLTLLGALPGGRSVLGAGYRWFAARRYRGGRACAVHRKGRS